MENALKIEVLYEEICCLFGDKANMRYFERCLPQAEFIRTSLSEEPRFVTEDVDMLYFGSMSEASQSLTLEKLAPYRDRLAELIDKGTLILATGNAFEIFGKYIITEDGQRVMGLNLVGVFTQRHMPQRSNSLFDGRFGDIRIVGYTSRFSHSMYDGAEGLFDVVKGYGLNGAQNKEGVRNNNFFGTYLLGPLLIQNPDFTKYLMTLLGVQNPALYLEEQLYAAYRVRCAEFDKPIRFYD